MKARAIDVGTPYYGTAKGHAEKNYLVRTRYFFLQAPYQSRVTRINKPKMWRRRRV